MKINEQNFILELTKQNEDALEYVVREYGGLMKSVIRRILYDSPEDAEECFYDAVLKIWEHSASYSGTNSFKSWAAAVAKHTALDRLRKLRRLEPTVDIDEVQLCDPAGLTGDADFDSFFAELIACLNAQDQQLFIRIFWQGESIREASGALGLTEGAAYNRLSRGKKKIMQKHPGYFRKEES